jgi:hypothetical protein
LLAALLNNKAKYHKSYRSNFSDRELSRKTAASDKLSGQSVDDSAQPAGEFQSDFTPYVKCIRTRSSNDSTNTLRADIPICFFCDMPAGSEQLHEVTMLEVDEKVKECALSLSDHRLLAKLAVSDMIAQEAKYHQACLTNLYNRRRSVERERYREISSSTPSDSAHSIVFAELTAYINDVHVCDNITPVFKLVDLKNMYMNRLQQLTDITVQPINSTRLKEKLLTYFPNMRAHNDGRDVILAFENSAMPIDQAHEQLNAVVKGDGGIVGLTANDGALDRWTIAGPEVARLLCRV